MNKRVRCEQATRDRRVRRFRAQDVAALFTAVVLVLAVPPAATAGATVRSAAAVAAPGAAGAQYALIVNGDDSFTHNYNVELALGSLRQVGYESRNTFVLAPAATGAGAPAGSWRQPATEQGLRRALVELRGRLRSGDRLLVYLTGHGYRMFGRASLGLQNGSITARELMQQLGELPFGELVLIADQCYSGAFVDAAIALGRNVAAVSSTDDRHEVRCEPFVRPLWLAAAAAGDVSVEDAFQTAASGLHRSGGAQASAAPPRYAASGTCAGRPIRFSNSPQPPAAAAAARVAGEAAGEAAGPVSVAATQQR
jgi:hypothetical protein